MTQDPSTADTRDAERVFHDEHYRKIADDDRFHDAESATLDLWHEHCATLMGALDGRRVLDCGTGDGSMSLWLARQGAQVDSFDISLEAIKLARGRAQRAGLDGRIRFLQCSFEDLPYEDDTFDVAFGSLILHHVELDPASRELDRILRPGARAVFSENFAFNPFLNFARNHLIGRFGIPRLGTLTEQPLGPQQIQAIEAHLKVDLEWPDFLFFQLLDRQVFRYKFRTVNVLCRVLDSLIYGFAPLRKYSYRGTMVLSPAS